MQPQNNQQNASEVTRIRELIDAEYKSCHLGLHGLRESARHKFITARQERIAAHIMALCEFADETTMLEVFAKLGE
jgi:hypothetical protein